MLKIRKQNFEPTECSVQELWISLQQKWKRERKNQNVVIEISKINLKQSLKIIFLHFRKRPNFCEIVDATNRSRDLKC